MAKAKPEWEKTNIAVIKAILKLGKPAFGDLLKDTGLSKPSLTDHLKELLNKKLIIAEKSEKDKRKWLYSLNPNELALITVDEAIEAIRNELKAVGEELKPEEEQKLREWLIKHFRTILIEELKANLPIAEYGIIKHLFDWLSSITLAKLIIDSKLMEERAEGIKEVIKTVAPKATFFHSSVDAIKDFPDEIAEKWSKTKAFSTNPTVILLNLFETGEFKLS